MRRIIVLLSSMALAMLLACGVALALPSESPDQTPMVNGTVRAIEHVGTNIWLGGNFSQVKSRDGTVIANVSNLAVFDSQTNQYKNIAPKLGGTDSEVWDMSIYGQNVLIAGKFSGPTSTQKNLLLVDGNTGKVIQWYNAPSLKSALAAPKVGRVYGGGVSLTAFELGGTKLWTAYKTTVTTTLYPDAPTPGYRDLELDADGQTIWAACACDTVDGKAAKVLVKLRTDGVQDTSSWQAEADPASWGMSVAQANGALYLGAGGSDYLAKYDNGPTATGSRSWVRDTSGSLQVVEVMDGQLVIGGHFWEVADQLNDSCGHGRSTDKLDLNGECQTRKGIAAYSFEGVLEPNWDPMYAGKYSLVWALHVEGTRLHTGGEFLTVNGVTQNYYARLSPDSIKGDERANTLTGTPNDDAIYGYGGADRIDARDGGDTLRLGGGKDKGQGGRGNDYLRAVDGSKDTIYCGPGADRVRANPGDNVAGDCEKVTRAGKRVA